MIDSSGFRANSTYEEYLETQKQQTDARRAAFTVAAPRPEDDEDLSTITERDPHSILARDRKVAAHRKMGTPIYRDPWEEPDYPWYPLSEAEAEDVIDSFGPMYSRKAAVTVNDESPRHAPGAR